MAGDEVVAGLSGRAKSVREANHKILVEIPGDSLLRCIDTAGRDILS